ncbi:MAG TPA: isochorismatase family cysteine hydrolase [Xanthobacteraceae bacterium]|jgi:nicotinamidase-related amidase|nr:isochorismatase family cysteine hydrolase [Xanthobacteraceae bacterium]
MTTRRAIVTSIALVLAALVSLAAAPASAQTVIDNWADIKAPPPPELKPVTVDPKTTALLMLDFVHPICDPQKKPRCVASLPAMKKLLGEARANHVMVVFSTAGSMTAKDIWADVAPLPGEPVVNSHPDKFQGTDLEKILKDKGIKTLIVTGVNANGAVLFTANDAALHGYKIIDPIDGSSAENEYIEQYVVYHFAHAPGVAGVVTLTRSDMIKF